MCREEIGDATLILGDCSAILPTLGMFDCVATDPPYGISYVSARRKRGPTEMLENDDAAPVDVIPHIAGALKDGGALYLATRFDVAAQWNAAINAAGLVLKTPIYWNKGNHTSGDLEGDFGAQVEVFIFAHKGRHALRGKRLANLWHIPRDPAGEHPTPKPVALMERMIACSTDAGGTILDPFMGSGSTGIAAVNLGRRFTGIEVNQRYFEIACERIRAAYAQHRLFA
jgi:site-specific DNA-methyltransferase (adenine-specific)